MEVLPPPLPQIALLALAAVLALWARQACRLGARKRAKAALRWVRRGRMQPGGAGWRPATGPGG